MLSENKEDTDGLKNEYLFLTKFKYIISYCMELELSSSIIQSIIKEYELMKSIVVKLAEQNK